MNRRRLLLAAALSPLVPVALFVGGALAAGQLPAQVQVITLTLIFALPTSYAGLLIFGWPLFVFLRRRDGLSMPPFLVSGAIGGVAMLAAVMALLSRIQGVPLAFNLMATAFGIGLGLSVSLVFCIVAGIRRA